MSERSKKSQKLERLRKFYFNGKNYYEKVIKESDKEMLKLLDLKSMKAYLTVLKAVIETYEKGGKSKNDKNIKK